MKGLLRKDCYLMMKYCRVFFLAVLIFTIVGIKNDQVFFCPVSDCTFQHYSGKPAFLR